MILKRLKSGTMGWSETALLTMVVTCGTRPATADIMKLVEPWQWMTALILSQPVSSTIFFTARGMIEDGSLVEVPGVGLEIDGLARQFSSQTS